MASIEGDFAAFEVRKIPFQPRTYLRPCKHRPALKRHTFILYLLQAKMQAEKLSPAAIAAFKHAYIELVLCV